MQERSYSENVTDSLMQERSYSEVVKQGMKRVCADFTARLAPFGFEKIGSRRWSRIVDGQSHVVSLDRAGSSYGAPISASVDLRIWLSTGAPDQSPAERTSLRCDKVRRPNGYAYHHRFNAQSWSTYDRCLDELTLFMTEFAERWFKDPTILRMA